MEKKFAELARIVRELVARVPHDDQDAHAELRDRADALVARAELPEPEPEHGDPEAPTPAPAS